jgi:cytochrome c oxidase assembly factor CtaG
MRQTSWTATIALLLLVPLAVYYPLFVVLGAPVWLTVRNVRQRSRRAH